MVWEEPFSRVTSPRIESKENAMKNRIVSLILFLCTVFSLLALSACGPKRPVTNPATSETATAATTDKWEVLAPKVKQLDEAWEEI